MPKIIQAGDFRDLIPQIQNKSLSIENMFFKGDKVKVFHEEYAPIWKATSKSLSKDGRIFYLDMNNGTSLYIEPTDEIQIFFEGENEFNGNHEEIRDLTLEEVAEIVKKRKQDGLGDSNEESKEEIY